MTTLSARATGSASAEVAWERYADPQLWHTWSPQIRRVEASGPRLVAGLTGRVHSYAPPPVSFVVLAVDEEARTWQWRASLGPLHLRLEHGVESAPGGSATWLRVHGPLPVVAAYLPLARLAIGRLVRP